MYFKRWITPFIGNNGNWWIGDSDTGISPTSYINNDIDKHNWTDGTEVTLISTQSLPLTLFLDNDESKGACTIDNITIKKYHFNDIIDRNYYRYKYVITSSGDATINNMIDSDTCAYPIGIGLKLMNEHNIKQNSVSFDARDPLNYERVFYSDYDYSEFVIEYSHFLFWSW